MWNYREPDVWNSARDTTRHGLAKNFLWLAFKVIFVGLILVTTGSVLIVIGYNRDLEAMRKSKLTSQSVQQTGVQHHWTYIGSISVGIGGFLIVAAAVMAMEARDWTTKVMPAQFLVSSSAGGESVPCVTHRHRHTQTFPWHTCQTEVGRYPRRNRERGEWSEGPTTTRSFSAPDIPTQRLPEHPVAACRSALENLDRSPIVHIKVSSESPAHNWTISVNSMHLGWIRSATTRGCNKFKMKDLITHSAREVGIFDKQLDHRSCDTI